MTGSLRVRMLVIPIAVAILVTAVFLSGAMEDIELLTLDYRMRTFAGGAPPPVAFAAIDSDTIKELGKWPIPRELYASALKEISSGGSRAILVDIDFSSAGPDPDEDLKLIEAVQRTENVVLAVQMVERPVAEGALVRSVSLPMQGLIGSSTALGSITFEVDPDGVVRRVPEPIDFIDEVYYPLGIVGARIFNPELQTEYIDGALINMSYENLQSLPVVSFREVIKGEFDPGTFRNRIVILGATTPELHDFWLTPIGVIPGIYIQAAVIQTALGRSWYLQPGAPVTIVSIIVVSLVIGLLMGRASWLKGLVYLTGFLVFLGITAVFFAHAKWMIAVTPLITVGLIQYPVYAVFQTRGVEKELAQTRQKTEAILKFSELRAAEEAGKDDYLVPMVLLRQVLDLKRILLFRTGSMDDHPWKIEHVFGDNPDFEKPDFKTLQEVVDNGEILSLRNKRDGAVQIFVPMMTSRSKHGVLFVEGPYRTLKDHENVRLLLSYATQASYYFETWALDQNVKSLYANTIKAITRALDSRDFYTSAHSELSLEYVEKFGRACGLDRVQIESLHIGTLLHDIGKIGIPDDVLNKKGELTGTEWEVLRQHPVIGFEIIKDLPFPHDVKMIVRQHHERFDGSGYPDGLKGSQIPLLVRIFCVLDTYEALIGVRPYKEPMDPAEAKEILREESGSHFDPRILDAFLSIF